MKSYRSNSKSALCGLFLLGFLFYTAIITNLYLFADYPVNKAIVPLSIILSSVTVFFLSADRKVFLTATTISILFIFLTAIVNTCIYDSTFDSIGYHYDISVMIAEGWNPIYQLPINGSIWARHYAKAIETIGSAMLSFTGNLQSVKCINFIFLASSLFTMWYSVSTVFPNISKKWKIALIFIAASNPILIWQLPSAYNDYCIWVETILLLSAFMLLWADYNNLSAYILILFTISLGINTKFTHFFYLGLECLFFAGWCLYFKRYKLIKNGFITVSGALIIGIFIIGYNPYVLNTINYSNPVYPLLTDRVDIMTGNTPEIYNNSNRVVNFTKSLLSLDEKPWALVKGDFSFSGISNSYANNMRVNGFGIFMFPMLVLGLMLMIINKPSAKWWIVYLSTFAMSMCFEQSWWARYIPFLWLAIVIPVVISLTGTRLNNRVNKHTRLLLLILCFINASLSVSATVIARLSYTTYINYVFSTQKELDKPINVAKLSISMRQQFKERDIKIIEHESISNLSNKEELFRVFGFDFFDSVMELPADDYPKLYEDSNNLLDKIARYNKRKYLE